MDALMAMPHNADLGDCWLLFRSSRPRQAIRRISNTKGSTREALQGVATSSSVSACFDQSIFTAFRWKSPSTRSLCKMLETSVLYLDKS